MKRVLAAAAALSLAATPAVAASAPVAPVPSVEPMAEQADGMGLFGAGAGVTAAIFFALIVVAIGVWATNSNDKPASP